MPSLRFDLLHRLRLQRINIFVNLLSIPWHTFLINVFSFLISVSQRETLLSERNFLKNLSPFVMTRLEDISDINSLAYSSITISFVRLREMEQVGLFKN